MKEPPPVIIKFLFRPHLQLFTISVTVENAIVGLLFSLEQSYELSENLLFLAQGVMGIK